MSFYYHYPYYCYHDKPIELNDFNQLTIKEKDNFVLGRIHFITSKYNLFSSNPYVYKLNYDYVYNHCYASDRDIVYQIALNIQIIYRFITN
jgi:hypothetical protein